MYYCKIWIVFIITIYTSSATNAECVPINQCAYANWFLLQKCGDDQIMCPSHSIKTDKKVVAQTSNLINDRAPRLSNTTECVPPDQCRDPNWFLLQKCGDDRVLCPTKSIRNYQESTTEKIFKSTLFNNPTESCVPPSQCNTDQLYLLQKCEEDNVWCPNDNFINDHETTFITTITTTTTTTKPAVKEEKTECVPFEDCKAKNLNTKSLCNLSSGIIHVMCPISAIAIVDIKPVEGVSISETACQQYRSQIPKVNNDNNKFIVNGIKASPREFPHMALLGTNFKSMLKWFCGGSLISEFYVLTAAHCETSSQFGNVSIVRLGDLNIKSESDDAQPQDFEVEKFIKHPNYETFFNDIALIKLKRMVIFNSYIRPICLQSNPNINSRTVPIATGWGSVGFIRERSFHLLKVYLEYFSNSECRVKYRTSRANIDSDKHLCAGSRVQTSDACQGDSGGPLQVKEGNSYRQIGITSFGQMCGIPGVPGVYTRVSTYIRWIENIVWPER